MIKLKHLIKEWGLPINTASGTVRSKASTYATFLDLKGDYSEALGRYASGYFMYRGINHQSSDVVFVSPSSDVRSSKHTSNHYTSIIDLLPSWNGYPLRSKSITCSNNYDRSMGYGKLYIVLPKNGSRVAWGIAYDFWSDFPYMNRELDMRRLSEFNEAFDEVCYLRLDMEIPGGRVTPQIVETIDTEISRRIDKWRDPTVEIHGRTLYSAGSEELFAYIIKNWKNSIIDDVLDPLFDPTKNEIQVRSISNLQVQPTTNEYYSGVELWTDGDCFLLTPNLADKVTGRVPTTN